MSGLVLSSSIIDLAVGVARQLTLTTQPSASVSTGVTFAQQPVVQVRNAYGTALSLSGLVVTVSVASGTDTLGGTLTATTNASGIATFTNLVLTGNVTDTLVFSAPGLTSVVSNSVVVSSGAATPDIVNNVSLETGWDGFDNGGGAPPTSIIRDNANAYDGSFSAYRAWSAASGGAELGGGLRRDLGASYTHIYARWYYYFTGTLMSTIQKFLQYYNGVYNGVPLCGLELNSAGWSFYSTEGLTAGKFNARATTSPIMNAWTELQFEFQRTGHASGRPAARLWQNGTLLGWTNLQSYYTVDGNGYLVSGTYNGVGPNMQSLEMCSTINGGTPAQTNNGDERVDYIAFSTQMIGP